MRKSFSPRVLSLREAQWYTGNQDSAGRFCHTPFFGWLDSGYEDTWTGKQETLNP
jgi:hypothetical protein